MPGGRPKSMNEVTIQKLEEAFLVGASDSEATFIADIAMSTLYLYCQENPEFSERKEKLKDMVKYQARNNVATGINQGDKALSTWYLERKAKNEFAQRTEQTGADGKDLIPDKESKDKIGIVLDTFLDDNTRASKQ